MNKRLTQLSLLLNKELGLFLSISFGIFLFILFFQPFPSEEFDFNNQLIFVAGFGLINFLLMIAARYFFPWFFPGNEQAGGESFFRYLKSLILLTADSVAFVFYLRYVGQVQLSFYIIIKIIIICMATPVILWIYDSFRELKERHEVELLNARLTPSEPATSDDYQGKTIELASVANDDRMNRAIEDIAFIKSADNYVEIVYRDDGKFKKKLIRNSLKNLEQQLKPYPCFVRCHRICLVNTRHIEKLTQRFHTYFITIRGYAEQIPVSRQYLLKVREICL